MLITMRLSYPVSEDGHTVRDLKRGETYDIADTAARRLIRDGLAYEPRHMTQADVMAKLNEHFLSIFGGDHA